MIQLLYFVVVGIFLPFALGGSCPSGWAVFGDYCYLLSPTQWDFQTGRSVCQDRQADLVSFQTVEEREFVKVLVAGTREEFWIGAQKDSSGAWIWTDGTQPGPNDDSIKDWDTTAECPDGCDGDCVQMNHWNGLWTNVQCSWSRRYICKRKNDILDACDFEGGWHPYSGKCYKYVTTKKTWQDAEGDCVQNRGHLAILNTQDKFSILEEIVNCKDYQAGVWIGLSDTAAPPEYKWADNSPLTDLNWDTDQPKNMTQSGGNCVNALPVSHYKWRVDTCDRENEYTCERAEGTCAEGWTDYGTGYCYSIVGADVSFRKTWTDGHHFCTTVGTGAQLMKIESDKQQEALKAMVGELAAAGASKVFIGLSDMQRDNELRWSDGSSVIYTNYGSIEQVTRRIDCGFIGTADANGTWNTGYCFELQPFICQIPIHRSPTDPYEPSGWQCPDGWLVDNRTATCFQFPDVSVPYQQALSSCTQGKFLVISSMDEQSFLSSRMKGRSWIGYEFKDGTHQWYDGSPVTFENWQQGGFDNGSSLTCTVMSDAPAGSWVSESCAETRYYICKQPATHVTATTAPTTPTAPWTYQCGSGWSYNPSTQSCYRVVNSPTATWENAQLACKDIGANLVSIHGEHETAFINGLLSSAYAHVIYWIGANDLDQNKGWQWTDGSPFYYFDWNEGEPNYGGGTEWCVELSTYVEGRWNDNTCDTLFGYICKKAATSWTPMPSVEPSKPPVTCATQEPLLSGYHYIRDLGFLTSSHKDGRLPSYSRLNHIAADGIGGSWSAGDGDTKPFVMAYFTHYVTVLGIETQGAGDNQEWVAAFNVMFRLQYGSFYEYVRDASGEVKLFTGNTDSGTTVQNMFDAPVLAHAFRIYPTSYNGAISMRFELLGCVYEKCVAQPLVSGESMVPNERMTASGSWDAAHLPDRARLHYRGLPGSAGGWVPNSPFTVSQWHQVQFDTWMTIYAVQTQGREDYPQWITKYKLLYTSDLNFWETYQEPYGVDKILTGNSDQNTLVTNYLNGNIYDVKYLRINPQEWAEYGIGLRIDILGCISHWYGCTDIPLINGASSYIPNSRLTASSALDGGTGPAQSRLHTEGNGEYAGAWVPSVNDANQWIQADLGRTQLVVAVATQGRQDQAMFITLYKLSYSKDISSTFIEYQVNGTTKLFPANWEQHFVHKTFIDPSFEARYVKLHPVEWNVSIALRWEIYACAGWAIPTEVGCYKDVPEDRDLNGASIMNQPEEMTQSNCINFCYKQGYIYAGLQYGSECFCGNAYGRYGPSEDCGYPCNGDRSGQTICGGSNCNTVFTTGAFSSKSDVGCWGDAEVRDLPYERYMDIPGGSTLDYCAMHCFNKGYRYAGAQFGSECSCGNSYGRYGPSTKCNVVCPGDHTNQTMCGGEWSNSVMSTGLAADQPRCRDGWMPYEEKCYLFTTTRSSWSQARTNCHTLGSELATVNSARVNDFVISQMALYDLEMWIGLHCLRQNNYFEWASGDPVLYTNWNRREPNSAGEKEDCVMLYKNGLWNDDPCDSPDRTYGYVCELPKEDIPDASTPTPDTSCPWSWVGYRWKCFTAGVGHFVWSGAQDQCIGLGGNLARIEDSQEQAFLSSTYGMHGQTYWTDLTQTNGQFLYSNGNPPSFTHWGQGQPADNGGSGCVTINMTEYGLWQSISCSEKPLAICEGTRKEQTRPSTVPTQPAQGSCANGWQPLGDNHCFIAQSPQTNLRLTWTDALASCRQMGADLVSIHNIDEENQIRTHLMSKTGDFWIGLNAIDNAAGFVWSDGTPVDFEYWTGPGLLEWKGTHGARGGSLKAHHNHGHRPSLRADGKDCVDMYQATGTWNAIECTNLRNWICKIPKGVSPTVAATTPAPSAGPPGSCAPDSDDWKFFNGRCYLFTGRRVAQREVDTSEFNWYNAENACRQYGGHLASLHTEDEQRFVEGQISAQTIEAFNFWIGLSDMNNQLAWQWSDGTPTDYINWDEGEPDNAGGVELCTGMEALTAVYGRWSDKHCESIFPFICVKAPGGVTITTTPTPPMSGYCPSGYLSYANKCFQFFDEEVEWNLAHEKCQQTSPTPYSLASISDPWENAFLQSQMADRAFGQYWIGLYQFHAGNGEFGWIDNTQVTYTGWGPGEPNGGVDEGCVEMYADVTRAGKWNDAVCSVPHPYVCMRLKDPSVTSPPPPPANDCVSGYSLYRGNCYKADPTTRSWQAAEDQCKTEGGHLASVANGYEMGFLISMFKGVANELWIGLTDQQSYGRYAWSDGTTTSYTYWGAGKPEFTDGGCVHISYSLSGYWADSRCDSSYASVCKITRVVPPYTRPPEVGLCPSDNVGDNWIEFGGQCYLFRSTEAVSQADAGLACQTRRSFLVSIHSVEENQFIYDHLQPNTLTPQWIGLIRSTSSEFIWSDGSSAAFFNWNDGEPNNGANGDENCVEMVMYGNSKWNDATCKNTYGYICKKAQVFSSNTTLGPATTPPPVASTAPPTPPPSAGTTPPKTTLIVTAPSTAKSTLIEIPASTPTPSGSSSLSTSAIVGIVFGCVALAMIVVFIGLLYISRKRRITTGFNNPTYPSSSSSSSVKGTNSADEGHTNYGSESTA